jgi:hypothetical protein
MLIRLFTLILFAWALLPNSSQATSGHEYNTYFVTLHFKDTYFDKKVKAVFAHVGIQYKKRIYSPGELYWVDVKHLEMSKKGDHFFQKIELEGEFHTHYGDYLVGPIVQYWVYFEDGTELKTKEGLIHLEDRPQSIMGTRDTLKNSDLYKQNKKDFENLSDTDKTKAIKISASYAS